MKVDLCEEKSNTEEKYNKVEELEKRNIWRTLIFHISLIFIVIFLWFIINS